MTSSNRLRRPSPALLISIIALVAATAGTSYAALELPKDSVGAREVRKNAIRSAELKNGSVALKDLSARARAQLGAGAAGQAGDRGPQGTPGAQGERGPQGERGAPGDPASMPTSLPSGRTLQGVYANQLVADEAGVPVRAPVTFQLPVTTSPTVTVMASGAAPSAACPGTVGEPAAAPGNLCIYERSRSNAGSAPQAFAPSEGEVGTDPYGFMVRTTSAAAGQVYISGTWAVTAP